jgi:lipid-A-disaccharide synthase-like uncharacterized protein
VISLSEIQQRQKINKQTSKKKNKNKKTTSKWSSCEIVALNIFSSLFMVKKGENTRMRVNVPQLIWNFSFLHKI